MAFIPDSSTWLLTKLQLLFWAFFSLKNSPYLNGFKPNQVIQIFTSFVKTRPFLVVTINLSAIKELRLDCRSRFRLLTSILRCFYFFALSKMSNVSLTSSSYFFLRHCSKNKFLWLYSYKALERLMSHNFNCRKDLSLNNIKLCQWQGQWNICYAQNNFYHNNWMLHCIWPKFQADQN